MGIKDKKTGSLGMAKKRDFIEIYAKLKVESPLGGYTTSSEQLIYKNFADVKRMSQYWVNQYGFAASDVVYEIFINPTAITIDNMSINTNPKTMPIGTGDYNDDYNNDYKKLAFAEAIKAKNVRILWQEKDLKVSYYQDVDDNLGQKIRIVAQTKV